MPVRSILPAHLPLWKSRTSYWKCLATDGSESKMAQGNRVISIQHAPYPRAPPHFIRSVQIIVVMFQIREGLARPSEADARDLRKNECRAGNLVRLHFL